MTVDTRPASGQLAAALAKAQGSIREAAKSRNNPHFKSRYSTLSDIWEAAREPLTSNGLSVAQFPVSENGLVGVRTVLLHESGETLEGTILEDRNGERQSGVQATGSILTYLRRYSLAAVVGVTSDEDDDGNAASSAPPKKKQPPPRGVPDAGAILRAGKAYGYDKAAVAETCKSLHGKLPSRCNADEIEDLLIAMKDNPKGDA